MNADNGFEMDLLLEEVLGELANPASPAGMEMRLIDRIESFEWERSTMSATLLQEETAIPADVSAFGNVDLPDFGSIKQRSVFGSLWSSLRDVVQPRMPELVLESRSMAAPSAWDRMHVERPSRATMGAVLVHAAIVLALVALVYRKAGEVMAPRTTTVSVLDAPPAVPLHLRARTSGGGGGKAGAAPVSRGNLPKFAREQILAPKAPPLQQPRIAVEPVVKVPQDLKMARTDLPQIGMPNSPLIGTSMGNGGKGGGMGSGVGTGIGPGSGGGMGGGIERIGGSVSAPVLLIQPEPEFSEEARKAKASGNVLVYLQVDEAGRPQAVRVLRGIGLGLDEKAVAAVQQYRFKPAMKNGKPVRVEMHVEVNFQVF